MTDTPDPALVARARDVFDRSIADLPPIFNNVPEPELIARLERAMLALPRTTREVFLANRLGKLSYAEIAKITGFSEHQVRRHMAKALEQALRYARGDERTAWQRWWRLHRPRWFC